MSKIDKLFYTIKLIFIFNVLNYYQISGTDEGNCPNGWLYFSNGKCYKHLKTVGLVTEHEAKDLCAKESTSAQLITIHDKETQEFVFNKVFTDIIGNAWIGLEFRDNRFQWADNSPMDFHHWDDMAIIDGSLKCVTIELNQSTGGDWNTTDCSAKGLVGCQTITHSYNDLYKMIIDLTKVVNQQIITINILITNTSEQQKVIDKQKLDLKELEISMTEQKSTTKSLQTEIINQKTEIQGIVGNYSKHQSDVNQLKSQVTKQDTSIKKLQTDFSSQTIDIKTLKTDFLKDESQLKDLLTNYTNLDKDYKLLNKKVDSIQTGGIPIGFIYIQLPNQHEPSSLFSNTKWQEVSSQYAGLFFRVLGGNSGKWQVNQDFNTPGITKVNAVGLSGLKNISKHDPSVVYINRGWSEQLVSGDTISQLQFYLSDDENRPQNTAIKIWKRIEN
ncbi:uncharacterized protein LOC128953647 [Oppia nitens]|uniref:uncharacterized protein LOC128953647 n=1 Tax=Oppia nitens TaxID=1686743 RepID=UPI0023DA7690|nr:uncharacterized protein LOC128953647 [Oppia nitens]